MYDFAIVGGGIVGLSTGIAIYQRFPNAKVVVIEKESVVAEHQTGHNSGVIISLWLCEFYVNAYKKI